MMKEILFCTLVVLCMLTWQTDAWLVGGGKQREGQKCDNSQKCKTGWPILLCECGVCRKWKSLGKGEKCSRDLSCASGNCDLNPNSKRFFFGGSTGGQCQGVCTEESTSWWKNWFKRELRDEILSAIMDEADPADSAVENNVNQQRDVEESESTEDVKEEVEKNISQEEGEIKRLASMLEEKVRAEKNADLERDVKEEVEKNISKGEGEIKRLAKMLEEARELYWKDEK